MESEPRPLPAPAIPSSVSRSRGACGRRRRMRASAPRAAAPVTVTDATAKASARPSAAAVAFPVRHQGSMLASHSPAGSAVIRQAAQARARRCFLGGPVRAVPVLDGVEPVESAAGESPWASEGAGAVTGRGRLPPARLRAAGCGSSLVAACGSSSVAARGARSTRAAASPRARAAPMSTRPAGTFARWEAWA